VKRAFVTPLRDAKPRDFARILALNEASVRFLSPLTPQRLALLHGQSAYHRVVEEETDGQAGAFLLAFREGSAYDSINYRWFTERYERFLYIDRIVVGASLRGQGVGRRMYEDLFAFARETGAQRVALEFDVDPPNEASRRFHANYAFAEVGSQTVDYADKRVSMQVAELGRKAS
jgi:predicted GNAT superfamily acetyltransferase